MSWRDRDYARFREDERRVLFGSTSTASPRARDRRRAAGPPLLLAVGISAIAVVAGRHHLHLPLRAGSSTPVVHPSVPAPGDVISIRWRAQDLAPASSAGRLCVSTSSRGRICASFVVGEKPADTLTRRLEALGLDVRSSG